MLHFRLFFVYLPQTNDPKTIILTMFMTKNVFFTLLYIVHSFGFVAFFYIIDNQQYAISDKALLSTFITHPLDSSSYFS